MDVYIEIERNAPKKEFEMIIRYGGIMEKFPIQDAFQLSEILRTIYNEEMNIYVDCYGYGSAVRDVLTRNNIDFTPMQVKRYSDYSMRGQRAKLQLYEDKCCEEISEEEFFKIICK
ncbi:MAG: hypothetical protein IKI94_08430 [Ruminococcus sp.]|nr:hypothetical protein [Ruminococcus sp.]